MLKRLIEWFRIHRRFAELQTAHDARLMLNHRLSRQNADLKSQLHERRMAKTKPLSSAAQKHIAQLGDQYSRQKALHHIALMRREVTIRKLALKLPFQDFVAIQAEVDAMTDKQVLAYKKPKLQIPTSNSN